MIDDLLSRASVTDFEEPGPDAAAIHSILSAAVCAPDHGKLRPWRFFLIQGEARTRLSELFAGALARRDPAATDAQLAKERAKPMRSPLTIAVVAKVVEGHKIPVVEQIISTGAAAMNILNAVHALGFGAKWVTGLNCYDPDFLSDFGLASSDRLLGFIHIGSIRTGSSKTLQETVRPDASDYVTHWPEKANPNR
jgi:nitroreductase